MIQKLKAYIQGSTNDQDLSPVLLSAVNALNESEKTLLISMLDAEQSASFFKKNHRAQNIQQLNGLHYESSTKLSSIMGLINGLEKFNNHSDASLIENSEQALNELVQNGFCKLPKQLPLKTINSIKKHLEHINYVPKSNHKKIKIRAQEDLDEVTAGTLWAFDQQEVLTCPDVQNILMDTSLLSVIQDYLQAPPIHVQCNAWWSKPADRDNLTLNSNAQMFHQDKEYIKFLKVFIYLTDVTEQHGPHQFITGSHQDAHLHTPENYSFSDRLTEEYILNHYPSSKINTFTGEAGTIIIEDTSGFHRGLPPIAGARLMLQFEFACSLYFNPGQPFSQDGLSADYKDFLKQHAKFRQAYNPSRYNKFLSTRNRKLIKNKAIQTIKSVLPKYV